MFQAGRNRTHHKLAGEQASRGGSQPGPVHYGGWSPGGSTALSLEAVIPDGTREGVRAADPEGNGIGDQVFREGSAHFLFSLGSCRQIEFEPQWPLYL